MTYDPPIEEMAFLMEEVTGSAATLAGAGLDGETLRALLGEAGNLCADVIAPLDHPADLEPSRLEAGEVVCSPGWRDAYRHWREAGLNGVSLPQAWGGMGLPQIVGTASMEMLTSASMAFSTLPVLTQGMVEALARHAGPDLQAWALPKLVSGEWSGAMALTEPQAGSDLGAIRTRAVQAADGSYSVTGSKIFITFGEHDLTDNILHLVLARLPDAPEGSRGISLFLVPKWLEENGQRKRNAILCTGLEKKLGIRASPTCSLTYDGAKGFMVGSPHQGLPAMFTMMNRARLATGMQGVALAERATQQATAYARDRRQGRGLDGEVSAALVRHPDVARMLMIMRALTDAGRAIAYLAAAEIDRAETSAEASARADLLTPIVKAHLSQTGVDVTSLGIQVFGGAGYIEETGMAQLWRDARIAPIYEGTNGIQAIDLVMRKLPREDGAVVLGLIAALREEMAALGAGAADEALGDWRQATSLLLDPGMSEEQGLAVASPYLRLAGLALGGTLLRRRAHRASMLIAAGDASPLHAGRVAAADFYEANIAPETAALLRIVRSGAASVIGAVRAFGGETALV
ncbi:acyl-CoA dehydrogenase [Radicibacter daui]|uniref:acyl-CoA dehydrogenase n=1 Tax=Radicibacter daui TaxID=3064829 RepID=UPI004046E15E